MRFPAISDDAVETEAAEEDALLVEEVDEVFMKASNDATLGV
jgi:hypothetical protein